MNLFNDTLETLQADLARKRKLEAVLDSLCTEKNNLVDEEQRLAATLRKEQRDVRAMEGVSLSSIFSAITGNKDERLNKERMEAHAAALKHDAAVHRLERVESDIKDTLAEIDRLSGAGERFNAAVSSRLEEIKRSGGHDARRVYDLEERIGYLCAQMREIDEAISAGNAAIDQILSIEESLGSARSWGTLDILGGGFISGMVKHSHLDDAQNKVEHLQYLLSRFRTELSDVSIRADLQIQVDGFLRFADYFFDGIIADWAVLDRINESQGQVENVKCQVHSIMGNLVSMRESIELEINKLRQELGRVATESR